MIRLQAIFKSTFEKAIGDTRSLYSSARARVCVCLYVCVFDLINALLLNILEESSGKQETMLN